MNNKNKMKDILLKDSIYGTSKKINKPLLCKFVNTFTYNPNTDEKSIIRVCKYCKTIKKERLLDFLKIYICKNRKKNI